MRVLYVTYAGHMANTLSQQCGDTPGLVVTHFGSSMMGQVFDLIVVHICWQEYFIELDRNHPPARRKHFRLALEWLDQLRCRLSPGGRIIEGDLHWPLSHQAPSHQVTENQVTESLSDESARGWNSDEDRWPSITQ